jgi:rRNA-processing protein FCF1
MIKRTLITKCVKKKIQKFKPNDQSKAKQKQKTKHNQQQRLEENQYSKNMSLIKLS